MQHANMYVCLGLVSPEYPHAGFNLCQTSPLERLCEDICNSVIGHLTGEALLDSREEILVGFGSGKRKAKMLYIHNSITQHYEMLRCP